VLARVHSEVAEAPSAESDKPFEQALARLARRLGGIEVGVARGAGMAKGFSHNGVLKALKSGGVPVDYLAGSSIGSIVGSVYAGGMALEQLSGLMTGADRRFVKLTLPFRSISSSRGLRKILTTCHERAPTAQFSELFLPFAASATDVSSGEEVVIDDGIVWQSVLASISMPGIFPPVEYRGRVLVDGGLVNPVPGKTVRDMGADVVIGIDLAARAGRPQTAGRARVPNIIEVLWRTMEIMLGEITSRSAASADVTIQPRTGHSRIRDFSHRGPEFIAAGEAAAAEALPRIRSLLSRERVAVAV
jgi:NTE family protein